MTSVRFSIVRCTGAAAFTFLLAGSAWSQASDQHNPPQGRSQTRQPTPSSLQERERQQESEQSAAEQSRPETPADRKMREMDRQLERTMRSICVGC